jgi:hypothetical protein
MKPLATGLENVFALVISEKYFVPYGMPVSVL